MIDIVDGVDGATSPHMQDTFSRYSVITFMGDKKKKAQTSGKVAHGGLEKWIGSSGRRV